MVRREARHRIRVPCPTSCFRQSNAFRYFIRTHVSVFRKVTLRNRFPFRHAIVSNTRITRMGEKKIQTSVSTFRGNLMFRRRIKIRFLRRRIPFTPRARGAIRNNHVYFNHTPFTCLFRFLCRLSYGKGRATAINQEKRRFRRLINNVSHIKAFRPYSSTPRPKRIIYCNNLRKRRMVPTSLFYTKDRRSLKGTNVPFQEGGPMTNVRLSCRAIIGRLVMRQTFLRLSKENPRFGFCYYRVAWFSVVSVLSLGGVTGDLTEV